MPTSIPYTEESYQLLHEGAIVLAEVEGNGMAVDVEYIHAATKQSKIHIAEKLVELEQTEVMKAWRRTYRNKTNLNSGDQLGHVLFNVMQFPAPKKTEGDKYSTDDDTLSEVDDPFVDIYLSQKKLNKAINTNLKGILREVVNGRIHCFFNLHSTLTYRSSSDSFNFQNLPVRDPVIAQLIRGAFTASKGNQIVEVDINGAEVVVAACYHKDPVMIEYILDPKKDMHRDTAMELFSLPQTEITKAIRHAAKNQFVFPQFYGDWYMDCAPALWKSAGKLLTASGKPLRDHLARNGMATLGTMDMKSRPVAGTFEYRVQQTEQAFWGKRFKKYAQWKKDWVNEYKTKGYIETLTGFICQGFMKKNEVINYPVQGSAFHCLLWSLIRIVNRELKRRNMKSLVVGQIHDSIVGDIVPAELDDYLGICQRVMTVLVVRRYPWLIVPMKIEAEVAPVGGSWADKEKYEIK